MTKRHPLKKLSEFRKDRGLSQDDLAKLLGVTKAAVSRWESGHRIPRRGSLPRLIEATGISASELMQLEEPAQ